MSNSASSFTGVSSGYTAGTPVPADSPIRDNIADAVRRVRETTPLAQSFTNFVTINLVANAQLAAGGTAAMSFLPDDVIETAKIAGANYINVGTLLPFYKDALPEIAQRLNYLDKPWVLDPVGVGMPWRTQVALDALHVGAPAVIRANASEVLTLAGTGASSRGPEAGDTVEDALGSAAELVRTYGTVVAISGPVDHIVDARRHVTVSSGHEWMARVTGVGCSLGALTAAFAGVQKDHLIAATSATAMLCVAAERAADRSVGPGGFAQALIDELFLVSPDEVGARGGLRDVTA